MLYGVALQAWKFQMDSNNEYTHRGFFGLNTEKIYTKEEAIAIINSLLSCEYYNEPTRITRPFRMVFRSYNSNLK